MAKKQPHSQSKRRPTDFATGQAAQSDSEWKEHEHVTPPLKAHAEQLVSEAGSPELAKHAVDSVAAASPQPAADKDAFARRAGFTSYLDLFEASTRAGSINGKNWFVTALPGRGWIIWNDVELVASDRFNSLEEARRHLPSEPAPEAGGTDGS